MNQKIMMKAVLDVMKDRFEAKNGRKTVTLPTSIEAVMPEVQVHNDLPPIDMTPVAEAIDRAFERQTESFARFNMQSPAPVVNVEPIIRYEASAPNVHVEATQVVVDMTPVAEAIQKQTDFLERLMGKIVACVEKAMDKGKEIEIIKDNAGKITGARRK